MIVCGVNGGCCCIIGERAGKLDGVRTFVMGDKTEAAKESGGGGGALMLPPTEGDRSAGAFAALVPNLTWAANNGLLAAAEPPAELWLDWPINEGEIFGKCNDDPD